MDSHFAACCGLAYLLLLLLSVAKLALEALLLSVAKKPRFFELVSFEALIFYDLMSNGGYLDLVCQ